MKVIEQEIHSLKNNISETWALVHQQLYNAGEAMLTGDKGLAYKIISREHRINALELRVDSDCEDIIALYAPVAISLCFVLAMYKINTNLERLGGFAEGVVRFVGNPPEGKPIDPQLVRETRVKEMLLELLSMILPTKEASEKESSEIASRIFLRDSLVDETNHNSTVIIAEYTEGHKDSALAGLHMAGTIRRMERLGDHCMNIVGELISYPDAKVMRHMGKTER